MTNSATKNAIVHRRLWWKWRARSHNYWLKMGFSGNES